METILVVAALVSLLVAAVMSVVAWTRVRESRDRAAARIEALEMMAFSGGAPEPGEPRDFMLRSSAPIEAATPMFGASVEQSAPKRRWLALVSVAGVMTLIVGMFYVLHAPELRQTAGSPEASAATDAAASVVGVRNAPIALLSLRHTTDGAGHFTVTGLVQNRANGQPLRSVVAVVDLFDQEGRYFASGKAALEIPVLQAGDESPFAVTVSNTVGVRRYRVVFRLNDGTAVAHVDRRDDAGAPTPAPRRSEG